MRIAIFCVLVWRFGLAEIIEETFGNGRFEDSFSIYDHISSSTEDLHTLLLLEKSIIASPHENDTIRALRKEVDYNDDLDTRAYIKHPINSFHLLVRCSKWFPKIFDSNHILHKTFSDPKCT